LPLAVGIQAQPLAHRFPPFAFEGREVRVMGTPEAPRWVVADVCEVLGLAEALTRNEPLLLARSWPH
jgi:prophage antirepressor-like protein